MFGEFGIRIRLFFVDLLQFIGTHFLESVIFFTLAVVLIVVVVKMMMKRR